MIKDHFNGGVLLLMNELDHAISRKVLAPGGWLGFVERYHNAVKLSDEELYDKSRTLLTQHLHEVVHTPAFNRYLKAFIISVDAILKAQEKGFQLFTLTRKLLCSYLVLQKMGLLKADQVTSL